MKTVSKLALALLAACSLQTAQAAPVVVAGPTGPMETNTSLNFGFASGSGAGQMNLAIDGFATLDGDNFWIDFLSIQLDGFEIFSGTWNLGGGGADRVLVDPLGATVSHVGAMLDIELPLTFSAGAHLLTIGYYSPNSFEGSGRAGFQGLGDEGWGIQSLIVEAPPRGASGVPEPASLALALAGLGLLGMRRRR